jgi:hypothetical protein
MLRQRYSLTWNASVATAILGGLVMACTAQAQDLGLEGPTGVFVTPLAYVLKSPSKRFGKPSVGYHFLDAGSVIGYFSNFSVTQGAFSRIEFGYTRDIHETADSHDLSPLWHNGFNVVHGKVNLLDENAGNHNWIPAVSAGFLMRTQVHNVGGTINGKDTTNGDVYVVATKTITQTGAMPIMLSGGFRGTNAELYGFAGNATRFQGRPFGAAAFIFNGPGKSNIIFASEVAPQPPHPEHLGAAIIPTTLTYAVRVVPVSTGEGRLSRFNVDFGIAQIAGHIMPGVDLKARHQVAMGISYGFQ